MATYKRPLIDKQRNTIHPITCTKAVYDDDGIELDEILRYTNYRIIVTSTSDIISTEVKYATLSASVTHSQADVTGLFCNDNYVFKWTRESGDSQADEAWNNDYSHYGHSLISIVISSSDINSNATFYCTLYKSDMSPTTILHGQIYIVDITDIGLLTSYINANQPNVQLCNSADNSYIPDYSINPLVLTPIVYLNNSIITTHSRLTITWKRRINGVEFDLSEDEIVNDSNVLTVSKNQVNSNNPYIVYVMHATYVSDNSNYSINTKAEYGISYLTGNENKSKVTFYIYCSNGNTFNYGDTTKTINIFAYYDYSIISDASFKWYKYIEGTWVQIQGDTSSSYVVNVNTIDSIGSYKCIMTYQDNEYSDVINFYNKTSTYQVDINSTNGNIFREAEEHTCLIANLYKSGSLIDALKCNYDMFRTSNPENASEGDYYHKILSDSSNMPLMRFNGTYWTDVTNNSQYNYDYKYNWYRLDANNNPMDSGLPFATGKVIYVKSDPLNVNITYTCEIINSSDVLVSRGDFVITNITTAIISDKQPLNPIDGMLWIDTSVTPNELKVYMNGEWKVVGASDENKNKVFTTIPVPPYRVGDLWLRTDDSGDKVIYYCTTARNGGSYDPNDWMISSDYQTPTEVVNELQNFTQRIISPLYGLPDETVIAWFQDNDPSIDWITDEQRTEHVGDTWYASNYDGIHNNIKLQRYAWSISTGYVWEEITNLAAIENYERAVKAQDTADGKRRVFFGDTNPNPPYDEGDLWSQGESGNLLVCNTTKTSDQSFDISDWEESARYTIDRELLQKQIDGRIQIWFQDLDPEIYAGIVSFTCSNENLSVGINGDEFEIPSRESGTYEFKYIGSSWTLNGSSVSLGSYGIQVIVGTPVDGDTITVVYQKPEDDVPWSTAVKAKHSGDLWYAPSTKITKRYTEYVNNNTVSFGWEVSDSLEALRAAQNAQSTADGSLLTFYIKNSLSYTSSSEITANIVDSSWNRVVDESGTYLFTYDGTNWNLTITYPNGSTEGPYETTLSEYGIKLTGNPINGSAITVNYVFHHPEVPYDLGDIWVNGDTGDTLICNTARTDSESYNRDDWDYGNSLDVFVNTTYRGDIINLEGLIDNKIDTWFQPDSPSTTWTTQELKRAHIGDVWYKDYDHIYRFNDDYQWVIVTDPATIQAYREAAAAQDTRDGKRRVFIGTVDPIPPYDRGDMWMKDPNGGTVLYCNVARVDGDVYYASDFVDASHYTDYKIYVGTIAPSDTSLLWLDTSVHNSPILKQYMRDSTTPGWEVIGEPSKIYTSDPIPPYNAGDIHIMYDTSGYVETYICINSRATGSYDKNDWVPQNGEDQIYIAPTPPADTTKLWIDTSSVPYVLKYYTNEEWVSIGRLQDLSGIESDIKDIREILTTYNTVINNFTNYIVECKATPSRTTLNVSIDKAAWMASSREYGEYTFIYNGSSWILNNTNVNLSDYNITINSGTPTNGDNIVVDYYSTKGTLGFSFTDYKDTVESVNGNIETLLESKAIQDQYFEFSSQGFKVSTSSDSSAVIIKNSGIEMKGPGGNTALTITGTEGTVNAPQVYVDNQLKIKTGSNFLIGNYKLDTTANGISLVWNG